MIHKILHIGDPRLHLIADSVIEFDTPPLHTLIQDMFDTMHAADGVGLAAPQIGINLRIIVFGFEQNPRYPEQHGIPYTVLINPELNFINTEQEEGWEGCLSVPGKRGNVTRYKQLKYRGQDVKGSWFERDVIGFHARVVQHECDHLNGILYPTRITDPEDLIVLPQAFPDSQMEN